MWEVTDIVRYLASFVAWMILIRMATFLWAYHHKVFVLRKQLVGQVLAPPVVWTYLYHIAVSLVVLGIACGVLYSANQGTPLNPFLLVQIPGLVGLFVAVDRFAHYYVKELEDGVGRLN